MGTPSLINPAQQDGYSAGSTDPAQQPPSAHPTNQQLQSPPPPPAAPQNSPQSQGDALEQLKQQMVQHYQANQQPPASGGRIKQLLGNFFSGMGDSMMTHAGLPTPYDQQQKALQNIQAISTTQNTAAYHQALANQFGSTDVTMPNGQTVGVLNKDLGKVYDSLARAGATTQAAQIHTGGQIEVAHINQGPMMPVTEEMRQILNLPPGTTQLPMSQMKKAMGIATGPISTTQGASGPALLNKLTGQTRDLGLGNSRIAAQNAHFVPVAEQDDQGNPTGKVTYMPVGQAAKSGAMTPGSTQFSTAKGVTKDFTSGASAKTLNSFNTATEHLNLLSTLGDALGNGDVQAVNSIGNRFAAATGSKAPTSFEMAKNAVAGEIAKTFKGQATEGEIHAINETINSAMSPEQLKGAIQTAKDLMGSKKQALLNQYQQGLQGKPAFDTTPQAPRGAGGFAAWKASQR